MGQVCPSVIVVLEAKIITPGNFVPGVIIHVIIYNACLGCAFLIVRRELCFSVGRFFGKEENGKRNNQQYNSPQDIGDETAFFHVVHVNVP